MRNKQTNKQKQNNTERKKNVLNGNEHIWYII